MTRTLTAKILAQVQGLFQFTEDLDLAVKLAYKLEDDVSLATGTGAGKADQLYFTEGTLAHDADVDIDLAGALTNIRGETITFARIKAIILKNVSDEQETPTAANLALGGGDGGDGTNAFATWISSQAADGSEYLIARAGGGNMIWASDATAYEVTADSADILRILNLDGADQGAYELLLVGEQA